MRAVSHPNVIELIGYESNPQWGYLLMPLVSGGSLTEIVAASGFSEQRSINAIKCVLQGLAALHKVCMI